MKVISGRQEEEEEEEEEEEYVSILTSATSLHWSGHKETNHDLKKEK